jgi:hypothetical protein
MVHAAPDQIDMCRQEREIFRERQLVALEQLTSDNGASASPGAGRSVLNAVARKR